LSNGQTKTRVVVIGGGPGGYPAAFYAADLGMDVTLIDLEENPGGVCLYRGCIPSKALLHAARVLHEARDAAEFGITFAKPQIDVDKLRAWKDSVVARLTGGVGQMRGLRNVKGIQGRARFTGPTSVAIENAEGKTDSLDFDYAILATGSRPTMIPLFDIGSERVLDSTSALDLPEVPKRMLVVGGGYIGLEMTTVYAALGSKVTVVEMLPQLLPGADKDLVSPVAKSIGNLTEKVMLNTRVTELKEQKSGLRVTFEDNKGETTSDMFDRVLVSIGRRPLSADLGLETTRVVVNDRGFVEIDTQRRTAEPTIFAIGDVAGDPMLAHKATHEGVVAVEAIAGKKTIFDKRAIPAVVFTDPELAWTGLTEAEAKEQGLKVKVSKFPWGASGRAITLARTDGVTKIIADPDTERILGVGITGVNAGDLIAEATLAIEMGATVTDLMLTVHPHPTLSETLMEAAEVYHGHSPHFFQKKK
jgi:dihydrolipoamide dehydrogenase